MPHADAHEPLVTVNLDLVCCPFVIPLSLCQRLCCCCCPSKKMDTSRFYRIARAAVATNEPAAAPPPQQRIDRKWFEL